MSIHAILFDKDGTLLNYQAFWFPVAQATVDLILKRTGGDSAWSGDLLRSIGADQGVTGCLCCGTNEQIGQAIGDALAAHGIHCPDPVGLTMAAIHDSLSAGHLLPVCDNLPGVLDDLHRRGYRLAVVTADDPYTTGKCLERLGIADRFDRICTDDGIHPSKPDPYYVTALCREFGLTPDELVMVGDTMNDVRFARNGGIAVIGVAADEQGRQVLQGQADLVVHDVSDLADALEQWNETETLP